MTPGASRRKRFARTVFALWLAACQRADLPSDAIEFAPPVVLQRWWSMTETCSGLRGSFDDVHWYRASANAIQAREGGATISYWTSAGDRVVLAKEVLGSGRAVRHEMLHALARQPGHPRALFVERCGGVVDCEERCEADGGSTPAFDATALRVPVESLSVAVSSFPARPVPRLYGGSFQITVTATNRATNPVVVDFHTVTPGFSLHVTPGSWNLTGGEESRAGTLSRFRAGETKQFVFDLRAGEPSDRISFAAGTYTFTGGFDERRSAPLVLTILP